MAEGSLAASLATLTPPRADSDSRHDSLSCCRVPLPCSGSPYARRLRTSRHYYSTTTVLLALSVHSRAHCTAPRDLGPLITDPLRSPLPSPVNGQRTPPSDKRHSSLRPTPHIPLQNHLDANVISYKPKLFIRLN